jgi:hypothetical protein
MMKAFYGRRLGACGDVFERSKWNRSHGKDGAPNYYKRELLCGLLASFHVIYLSLNLNLN